jgi:hypothetical protein
MNDDELKEKRESFFEGSGPMISTKQRSHAKHPEIHSLTRIEPRLRRLVVRACNNSCAATKVIQRFEDYLMSHYFSGCKELPEEWWAGLLVNEPRTKNMNDDVEESSPGSKLVLEFVFQDTQNAGFHRLLLHALCQFHGLKATARNSDNEIRTSSVSGRIEPTLGDAKLPNSLIGCIEEAGRC